MVQAAASKVRSAQSAAGVGLQRPRSRLDQGFQEDVEMLGKNGRCESLLALEVVIERALRDVDGRRYVPNADARVAQALKQRSGRTG